MIDRAGVGGGNAASGEANTSFDNLVRRGGSRGSGVARTGTERADVLRGSRGNDDLSGRGGDDVLLGGRGNDRLDGGRGNDLLLGGSGRDDISTGQGRDVVFAGSGSDRIAVSGSAYVDGGRGRDTVTLQGQEGDYTRADGRSGTRVYTSKAGETVILRNVEAVRFSEPTPPPPPPPASGGQFLERNAAGAEVLFVGPDSVRIVGQNTDFTFTDIQDNRPADGPLIARSGSGVINGVQTTAVPIGPFGGAVLSIGSGFNATGTIDVDAAFANGVTLDTRVVRGNIPLDPTPPPGSGTGQPLSANAAGATSIDIGTDTIRLTGPNTDVTFTGVRNDGRFDTFIATEGSGVVNGARVKAVPQDGAAIVIGPGGITGNRTVDAVFDNGVQLNAQIQNLPAPPPQGNGLALQPNDLGVERLIVGPSSARLVGPGTDFTFTGVVDNRPSDGPLTATGGSGTINGVETTAVPLGLSDPFDPGVSQVVFSLGSGFGPIGGPPPGVRAAFANGSRLDTALAR